MKWGSEYPDPQSGGRREGESEGKREERGVGNDQ